MREVEGEKVFKDDRSVNSSEKSGKRNSGDVPAEIALENMEKIVVSFFFPQGIRKPEKRRVGVGDEREGRFRPLLHPLAECGDGRESAVGAEATAAEEGEVGEGGGKEVGSAKGFGTMERVAGEDVCVRMKVGGKKKGRRDEGLTVRILFERDIRSRAEIAKGAGG
jgi:hypothetical protein